MRVGIVGCGLIGNKRAKALGTHTLTACADARLNRAQALAHLHPGCTATTDWEKLVASEEVDAVIVSTTNDVLAPAALAAVKAGKHVLLEKPGARSADELEPLMAAVESAGVVVKAGFNHRFHPSLVKAREIVDSGALGPLMFVRGRYGHGGRLGMDREWRGNPEISGGGEMLDQGVHLIDLSRWFLGEFCEVHGHVATFFWDWEVEDNGFAMLKTRSGQVAWLHASCTEWKNLFSFEIYGRIGKLHIEGLGGSYGVERLSWYRMLPQMGPPETSMWEYPGEDLSWRLEFEHFVKCIQEKTEPIGNLHDAMASLRVVQSIYAASQAAQEPEPLFR